MPGLLEGRRRWLIEEPAFLPNRDEPEEGDVQDTASTQDLMVPHAFLTLPTHPASGAMVFDLSDKSQAHRLIGELKMVVENGDPELTDDGEPWAVVEVRPMPAGYADMLPEHRGW